MVDSGYSADTYKSILISTGTIMRNPEMLKFFPDHLPDYLKEYVNMQLKNHQIY